MDLIDRHAVIEDVLDEWAPALGPARVAYGGHAYRVYNFARKLLGSARRDDELAVASAFHDIGIWSDKTFDYLAPSIARATEYVESRRPGLSASQIAHVIENHHRLGRFVAGSEADVVEAFRRADLVDVSRGWLRAGLDRSFLEEVVTAFPYAGFHGILLRAASSWFVRHPLRPLPMLRLGDAPPRSG